VKRISVGDYPKGIETSADGNSVYVVNWFSNEVWAIDAETLAVTAKMPVGDSPRAFGTFRAKRCEFFAAYDPKSYRPFGKDQAARYSALFLIFEPVSGNKFNEHFCSGNAQMRIIKVQNTSIISHDIAFCHKILAPRKIRPSNRRANQIQNS
jgi:YVTN family beta-propeller protein